MPPKKPGKYAWGWVLGHLKNGGGRSLRCSPSEKRGESMKV
ncbi:MAG: hypothetical protein QXH12_05705 [Candidatus Caldarchaeum sp.]